MKSDKNALVNIQIQINDAVLKINTSGLNRIKILNIIAAKIADSDLINSLMNGKSSNTHENAAIRILKQYISVIIDKFPCLSSRKELSSKLAIKLG